MPQSARAGQAPRWQEALLWLRLPLQIILAWCLAAEPARRRGADGMADAVAIVAGATGLVGRELVRQLAADRRWREVRALVRDSLPADLSGSTVA
jgi:hypothetical protein